MDIEEKIDELLSILDDVSIIHPEHSSFDFDEGFDFYIRNKHLRQTDNAYIHPRTVSFNTSFKVINDFIKYIEPGENFRFKMSCIDIKDFQSAKSRILKGIHGYAIFYDKKEIIDTINNNSMMWVDCASHADLTCPEEIKTINKLSENLNNLDNLNDLYKSVEKFLDDYSTFHHEYFKIESQLLELEKDKEKNSMQIDKIIIEQNELIENSTKKLLDPSQLYNKKEYSSDSEFMAYFKIISSLHEINNEFNKIYQRIMDTKILKPLTEAEGFIRKQMSKTENLTKFIEYKNSEFIKTYNFCFELAKNSKYPELFSFKDSSIVLKDSKGNYHMPRDNSEAIEYIKEFFDNYMDVLLRKKPHVANCFKKVLSFDYTKISECIIAMNTYLDNENILKANNFNIIENVTPYILVPRRSSFEKINDYMNSIILEHKVKKYADSITSNKYTHLYNEDSYDIIREMYHSKVDVNILQKMIGKKLASFSGHEDFNRALTQMLDTFNGFTMETILEKIKNVNTTIIDNENNVLILKIDNFEQSQLLGSPSWCISRDSYYFNSYKGEHNNQYFIYDFTKSSKDNESMIGITLEHNGEYKAAHLKNDDSYSEIDTRLLQEQIIKKDINSYPMLESNLKKSLKAKI